MKTTYLVLLLMGWVPAVSAAPTPAPMSAAAAAAAFGARERIEQISLSPDGTHVAIVAATQGRVSALTIADLINGGTPKPIMRSNGGNERLTDCHWSTDTRLVCNVFVIASGRDRIAFSRMLAINSDGSGLKLLSANTSSQALKIMQRGGEIIDLSPDDAPGQALMTRQFVPEYSTGSHLAQSAEGLGVELVDTTTARRQAVEPPRAEAAEYISDGHGRIRVKGMRPKLTSGYDSAKIDYFYRKPNNDQWLPLGRFVIDGGTNAGFNPYAVDRDLNLVYGFDTNGGHRALFSIALDGSMKRTLVLSRPDVDVAGLVQIGRQSRTVGASFITDRRQTQFFDPALNKLAASLAKALPDRPIVSFVDASSDENRLLLFVGSDTDPGRYYVFDKPSRKLAEVMSIRPPLDGVTLAKVVATSFPAADGTMIPGYLTLPPGSDGKNLPAIVLPHGGPGARDEWGFDWLSQFFAARGYAVLQPNFRGSTGYGDAWFQKNGFQSWRVAIGDVDDAGRWLVKQGIADPNKLAIVGWSYGGYAALQSSVLDPDLFKAIVAIAPVTDLDILRQEAHDFTNFAVVDRFIGKGPHVAQGSPARNAARIKAPVLLFHGDLDLNVGIGESRLMASRLKGAGGKVELVEFKGLDHQLEDDEARAQMLSRADAFLRASMAIRE